MLPYSQLPLPQWHLSCQQQQKTEHTLPASNGNVAKNTNHLSTCSHTSIKNEIRETIVRTTYLRVSCYPSHLSSTTLKVSNLLPKPDQLACQNFSCSLQKYMMSKENIKNPCTLYQQHIMVTTDYLSSLNAERKL